MFYIKTIIKLEFEAQQKCTTKHNCLQCDNLEREKFVERVLRSNTFHVFFGIVMEILSETLSES